MRARFRKLRENKDGFTLVELIVVLVILAILIGMLVPSLTGYIDKANEKAAMIECRQVVLAAQVKTSDEYGKGLTSVDFGDYSEIKEMAEVNGTINEIRADNGKVTYVKYTSKKGIIVIYENGEYKIAGKDDGSGGSGDPEKPDAGGPDSGEESGGGSTGGLKFVVDGIKFKATGDAEELYKEAVQNGKDDGAGGVNLPAGLYKVGNQYYYVNNQAYYNTDTHFQSEGLGAIPLNLDSSVKNYYQLTGQAAKGNIYLFEGAYYIAKEGAWAGYPPSTNPIYWGKIELAQ